MPIALEIKGLKKTYAPTPGGKSKTAVEALRSVDLNVEEGDFFALLGPNGAGKSTLINIVCGLVNKSEGEVLIDGLSIDENAPKAKLHVGVVPQEFNFGIFEKVVDIVVNQAGYYGIPRSKALPRAEFYLKKLGLWEKKDARAMELSGGMKRRLMIARALVHDPKLLILDEPTTGVDIELRRGMWEFLTELNKSGVTIILTTHYLEEAEQLCRNVAIINGGMIVAEQLIHVLWGPDLLPLPRPAALRGSFLIGDIAIEKYRLLAVVIGLMVFVAMILILNRTKIGLLIRAGVENKEMVEAMGYRIRRLFVAVFIVGSALAGLGGALWGMYQESVTVHIGAQMMVLIFIVIIIGGLGSVGGCFVGALLVGLVANYVGYLSPKIALGSNILLMMLILFWRPQGLYPVHRQ